jgi:predicted secreted protein
MQKSFMTLFLAGSFCVPLAHAGTTIELAADASRPAANDMVRASVYTEATGNSPAELAQRVNQEVAAAIKVIRGRPAVSVKSGRQSTYPVYGQSQKIENWRMRSELIIESRELASFSELLGKLQQMRIAVSSVSQLPSPETRRQVEDEATREAILAFQSRAAVVAGQLGKTWKIKQLNIQQGGGAPVPMMPAARGLMQADSTPAPIEAGESLVTTTISGQIELAD